VQRPPRATVALAVVVASVLALSAAAATSLFGSISKASACRRVSVSVVFHPNAGVADFRPVLAALSGSHGVLEIGFLSKQQALDEDLKEFAGTPFTFGLADGPPSYQVIVEHVVDARQMKVAVDTLHGVDSVVIGPDINRPFVTESHKPVGVGDKSLFYVGTVISKHCPS
jgi:cell division protein FtsX